MMKSMTTFFIVWLLAGQALAQGGQIRLRSGVFGAGGRPVANADYGVACTVGQPLIGVSSQAAYVLRSGFWHAAGGLATGAEPVPSEKLPTVFRLEQNYPNPFNPTTTICFALPRPSHVTLRLYDLLGRVVRTLVDEELPPGEYSVMLEAQGLASGMYLYRLRADGFTAMRKLMLLR